MTSTIIAKNDIPGDEFCLGIVVKFDNPNNNTNQIQALKAAAADYLEKHPKQPDEPFNWGDLVNEIDTATCKAHGFEIIDTFVSELVVDHNESLKPDDL